MENGRKNTWLKASRTEIEQAFVGFSTTTTCANSAKSTKFKHMHSYQHLQLSQNQNPHEKSISFHRIEEPKEQALEE